MRLSCGIFIMHLIKKILCIVVLWEWKRNFTMFLFYCNSVHVASKETLRDIQRVRGFRLPQIFPVDPRNIWTAATLHSEWPALLWTNKAISDLPLGSPAKRHIS